MRDMTQDHKILLATHPALRKKAASVASVDGDIKKLMMEMTRIMQEHKGVGLAATQIGVHKRVLTMDVSHVQEEKPNLFCMANPEIIWRSDEQITEKEYCFSVPDIGIPVIRPAEVKVRYVDEHNTKREVHAKGLLARCVQHEIDHLNGIVTIDYLSPLRRKMAIKKLKRMEENLEEETSLDHPTI